MPGRALRHCELIQPLAVVVLGGGGHAIGAMAQEHLVEVELQDLVLGELILDAQGDEHLDQFARIQLFRAEEEVACNLLSDSRAAWVLLPPEASTWKPARVNAAPVDAGMAIEVGILG